MATTKRSKAKNRSLKKPSAKVAPKKVTPKKVTPKKVASKKTAPKKVAPKKTATKKRSPKQASPNRGSPPKLAPRKTSRNVAAKRAPAKKVQTRIEASEPWRAVLAHAGHLDLAIGQSADQTLAELARRSSRGSAPLAALRSQCVELRARPKSSSARAQAVASLRLGAIAAECLRSLGGEWTQSGGIASTLGLTYTVGNSEINFIGKALKVVEDPNGLDDLERMVQHLLGSLRPAAKRGAKADSPQVAAPSGFVPVSAELEDGCAQVRSWKCPTALLFAKGSAEAYASLALGRAWALFGAPQIVEYCRFAYVLEHRATGRIVAINSVHGDIAFCAKGPELHPVIDALERELETAHPVDCVLEVEFDGASTRMGYRNGQPFMEDI